MLDDRYYMRQGPPRFQSWTASPTLVLLALNAAVFLVQWIIQIVSLEAYGNFIRYFALSGAGLLHGFVWQLGTYQFLHADGWHFFFNAFALFIFGKPVEMSIGQGRFYEVYFSAGVLGGLLQGIVTLLSPKMLAITPTVGASASVCGVLAIFCLIYRDVTLRLFFIIPIRAWNFFIGILVISMVFVVLSFTESAANHRVAHAAHLGGLLAGIAYFQWFFRRERRLFDWRPYADALRSKRKPRQRTITARRSTWGRGRTAPPAELPPAEFISKEVDPILDKISSQGMQSLTPRERKILEDARSKMQNR